jgi:hypothetical protein
MTPMDSKKALDTIAEQLMALEGNLPGTEQGEERS